MRTRAVLFLLSCLGAPALVAAPAVASADVAAGHPILGIWRLTVPGTECAETYRFRADGTTFVTSAAEVSESVYTVSAQPDKQGFYRLQDRIVKDNGKPDCSGEVMKVGTTATNYLQFHPAGDMFLMCAAEALDVCIGPFERVKGEQI